MKRLLSDIRFYRLVLILTAIILLTSIVGVVAASALPQRIEEHTTLLNYGHSGRFDYVAYLNPSYLFGPGPHEPPPPQTSREYPTKIIDRFDMSFSYRFIPDKSVGRTSAEIEVISVVRRPDGEQEEITLVPKTAKTGDFSVNFRLDMNEEISPGATTIITARVYTIVETGTGLIFETFTHSLVMRSREHLLEVDGYLKHTEPGFIGWLTYEEHGKFDYEVRLKPGAPFDAITMKPISVTPPPPAPLKTVGPGELLFSKLVDSMDVTFYYEFESDKPLSEVAAEVEINAILENPGVWTRTFVLMPRTAESGDFSVSFPLDIDYFTGMLEAIRDETGVSGAAHNLTIKADVQTVAQTDFGTIDEVFSQTLSTTLGGGTLEWSEELVSFRPGSIETTKMIPNPNRYLGQSPTNITIISAVIAAIFAPLVAYVAWLNFKFKSAEVPLIQKQVRLARKKFGGRIAEATSQTPIEGEKIISLGSMEDLSKVADELGKPIVHQAPTAPEDAHAYYVFDGVSRYEYLLTAGTKEQDHQGGSPPETS